MKSADLEFYIQELSKGNPVTGQDAEHFLDVLLSETDVERILRLLSVWDAKGFDADELTSLAKVMQKRAVKILHDFPALVDIVGTGGSKAKTFNVSTAAAIIAAATGIKVAKHGNRAASSRTGSADVLTELNVFISLEPDEAAECLDSVGMAFLFAPKFHSLSPSLAEARRKLGKPTIFNCLGPLLNPASANYRLIGVWKIDLLQQMSKALMNLGTTKSVIVHGADGLDEITLSGETYFAEVSNGTITYGQIIPEDFGIKRRPLDNIRVSSAKQSAQVIRAIFSDAHNELTDAKSIAVMNAAFALRLLKGEFSTKEAFRIALDAIESGKAKQTLDSLVNFTASVQQKNLYKK